MRRCVRSHRAGTLTRSLPTGKSSVAFSGRIARHRLAPGRERLNMSATDAAGNRSKTTTLSFTVAMR